MRKCAILNSFPILGCVSFGLFDRSHGLVPTTRVDVQTLTTVSSLYLKRARFWAELLRVRPFSSPRPCFTSSLSRANSASLPPGSSAVYARFLPKVHADAGTFLPWILPSGVSKQPVARISRGGPPACMNDSADHKEITEKMIRNIRTRNFVFRL